MGTESLEKKIVVLIPSFNNSLWVHKNLSSVISQNYNNFSVVYTDDFSSDNTTELVDKYISKHKLQEKINFIKNSNRNGALCNLYNMIHMCNDHDIIVTLDGDDWLAHNGVLNRINEEYQDNNVWFTWGSYIDHPQNTRGCSKLIPKQILDANSYRRYHWCTSHLRTFKAKLFKNIKREDFNDPDGNWLDVAWDLSFYIPFVEMGGYHGRYIDDILYIYNNENPIQDYKIKHSKQAAMDKYIRSKRRYERLKLL